MMPLRLRPVRREDEAFLLQVYASTRADEMALVPWGAEQKDAFVRMQFNAQRQSYAQQSPDAKYDVILRDEVPVGRLIVNRTGDAIGLMDIALLPEYRNAGLGTALIRDLMDEARAAHKPLRLHVEFFNPALRLYERLGFRKISESGIYYEMEWTPLSRGTGSKEGAEYVSTD
jgi:ribosomal protein S18 acetylase RimI-like enzyme